MEFNKISVSILLILIFAISNSYGMRKRIKTIGFTKTLVNWATADDCNFYGQDLNHYWFGLWSPQACIKTCEWYGPQCTHWAWFGEEHTCFLKSGLVRFSDAYPDVVGDRACGIRCGLVKTEECRELIENGDWRPKFQPGPPSKFLRSEDCFFRVGPVLDSFYNATADICAYECRRRSSCTHFNFWNGICDMLPGLVQLSDIYECESSGCACGVDCHSTHGPHVCAQSGTYEWKVLPDHRPPYEQPRQQHSIEYDGPRRRQQQQPSASTPHLEYEVNAEGSKRPVPYPYHEEGGANIAFQYEQQQKQRHLDYQQQRQHQQVELEGQEEEIELSQNGSTEIPLEEKVTEGKSSETNQPIITYRPSQIIKSSE